MMSFPGLLASLGVQCDAKCFIFRGFPDIIIHNRCAAVVGGSVQQHAMEGLDDGSVQQHGLNASSDEDSIVENFYQKPPLSGYTNDSPPEKVGEVFTGLHILLVAKILRKIHKGKSIRWKFEFFLINQLQQYDVVYQ